jgi:hypothetical protein
MKYELYRFIMRLAHRYNWHYAPPIYPDGDTQLWCTWCGLRYTKLKLYSPDTLKELKKKKYDSQR